MNQHLPVYAHRGASANAFENTMEAFEKAVELGADGIEIDIQTSSDGELFVIHDLFLRRLVGINKKINECSSEEVQTFSIGKRFRRRFFGQKIPTFKQVVKWAKEQQMPLNVELKESLLLNSEPLLRVLPLLVLPKGSHFSSFHDELLQLVKKIRPDFETALIITKKFDLSTLGEYSHIDYIHVNKKNYHRRLLQTAMHYKKGVRFYGIDGSEPFLIDPHPAIVGWITDYPDKIRAIEKV